MLHICNVVDQKKMLAGWKKSNFRRITGVMNQIEMAKIGLRELLLGEVALALKNNLLRVILNIQKCALECNLKLIKYLIVNSQALISKFNDVVSSIE